MSEQATTELGRFLRARREGVRPQDAGLPPGTGSRRTPGLRREEIATLAGVSIDYYTRLERGRETRPSPAVVDAPDLAALVGELLVKSPDFGRLWGRYEVRRAGAGDRVLRHPLVGTLHLTHETLGLNRADGHGLVVYLAEPGTPDHDAMVLLDTADLTAAVSS